MFEQKWPELCEKRRPAECDLLKWMKNKTFRQVWQRDQFIRCESEESEIAREFSGI